MCVFYVQCSENEDYIVVKAFQPLTKPFFVKKI